jgi:hypothetical protein
MALWGNDSFTISGGEPSYSRIEAMAMDVTSAATDNAEAQELVSSAVGDRCTNCQAPLASDQHYCVNCGERRGKARFASHAAQTPAPPPRPKRERAPRPSSGAALIAGVATLLLAMGIGFLIGNANNNGNTRAAAAAPQVITVAGGGVAASGSGATGTSNTPTSSSSSSKTHVKTAHVVITKKVEAAANAAASAALGGGASNLAPSVTEQPGQACSHGAGCQGGKFTGNFFGP